MGEESASCARGVLENPVIFEEGTERQDIERKSSARDSRGALVGTYRQASYIKRSNIVLQVSNLKSRVGSRVKSDFTQEERSVRRF